MQTIYKILFLGPQGSGKGTQSHLLAEKLNIPAFSMGQLLRNEIQLETELGKKFKSIVESGNLISNEDSAVVLKKRLSLDDVQNGYILDGFPRDRSQAVIFFCFERPTHVIVIEIPKEETLKRLSGRLTCDKTGKVYNKKDGFNVGDISPDGGILFVRVDDVEEAIEKRLEIYQKETKEIIASFQEDGIVQYVDGMGSVEDVHKRIVQVFI